jgi:hypothetical protein
MEDQSPPTRVTRARAAAKTDNTIKTARIATAASKAKAAKTTTATKRKTRADDMHQEEEHDSEIMDGLPRKPTRGRSKKVIIEEPAEAVEDQGSVQTKRPVGRPRKVAEPVEEEPHAPTRTTRGRPKKAEIEAPASEPVKATRGRPRKVTIAEEPAQETIPEATKKTTRGRPASTKLPAPPKKVTFKDSHEPDKENVVPPRAAKGNPKETKEQTGLKAKPIRKPAGSRATRGRKAVNEPEVDKEQLVKSPLSPKKATQIATAQPNTSEDELASLEKTPLRSPQRNSMKAPESIQGTAKKLDFTTSVIANRVTVPAAPDLSASILASPARRPPQSPWKDAMKSTPKRVNFGDSVTQSPFKTSMGPPKATPSAFKQSLLQSPAKRPPSPTKVDEAGSPSKPPSSVSVMTPKAAPFNITRFKTPKTTSKDLFRSANLAPASITRPHTVAPMRFQHKAKPDEVSAPQLKFSGRLSSVMPRETDPVASPTKPEAVIEESVPEVNVREVETVGSVVEEEAQPDVEVVEELVDPLLSSTRSTTPTNSPPRNINPAFELRPEDQDPFFYSEDSESEDELATRSYGLLNISTKDFATSMATPVKFSAISNTPKSKRRISIGAQSSVSTHSAKARREAIGLTPLARQLSDWMANSADQSDSECSSPEKTQDPVANTPFRQTAQQNFLVLEESPIKSTFFEDEMQVLDEVAPAAADDEEGDLSPVELDEQDLALAAEADEMSLIQPDEVEEVLEALDNADKSASDASQLSEASQEYGDENEMPIDPNLLSQAGPLPPPPPAVTPARVMTNRVFHTVSKVPLKPAAEDSPRKASPVKRAVSVSRVQARRPEGRQSSMSRSNTIHTFTPTKRGPKKHLAPETPLPPSPNVIPSSAFSVAGTPLRTPRPNLNPNTLKGAVVFVDVHTTEGADASGIFIELLVQMGARCVKTWNWNGNTTESETRDKVGITHVVFKDGGKRTLEKVRESNGIVLCVGVGWVLE